MNQKIIKEFPLCASLISSPDVVLSGAKFKF